MSSRGLVILEYKVRRRVTAIPTWPSIKRQTTGEHESSIIDRILKAASLAFVLLSKTHRSLAGPLCERQRDHHQPHTAFHVHGDHRGAANSPVCRIFDMLPW